MDFDHLPGYTDIRAAGHSDTADIFTYPVVVEEKMDGSQISFLQRECDGKVLIRSKGAVIYNDNPPNLFAPSVATILRLAEEGILYRGWLYRGEAMKGKRANILNYGRAPKGNIVLYDVDMGLWDMMDSMTKRAEAERLGLEPVPVLFEGRVSCTEELMHLLERESVLGNVKIEGFVVKQHLLRTRDKKSMMIKVVGDAFREVKAKQHPQNPTRKDLVGAIAERFNTEARFHKAVQHLREADALTMTPKDIGILIKEVRADILKEEIDTIKDELFKAFGSVILNGATKGFAEWFKAQLAAGTWD